MLLNELYGAGIVGLIFALISLVITIALIVAIFQINGRVGDLVKLQQSANKHLEETAELQRQTFIALLAEGGPNHKEYLDYLVDLGYLTKYQGEFILRQSGNAVVEVVKPVGDASRESAFYEIVEGNSS